MTILATFYKESDTGDPLFEIGSDLFRLYRSEADTDRLRFGTFERVFDTGDLSLEPLGRSTGAGDRFVALSEDGDEYRFFRLA